MREGSVVLTAIPQADGKTKHRPALILREMPPPYNDLLVCGISTQLQDAIEEFDELITSNDGDFAGSGLLKDSVIKLGFLAVVPQKNIVGAIGQISPSAINAC